MSARERRPEMLLGMVAATALTVLAARVMEKSSDVEQVGLTAEAGAQDSYGEMEHGLLHARAVVACDSLPQEREDDVIKRETGIPGKASYVDYQTGVLQNPTNYDMGQINAMNLRVLVGCLRERHARGDAQAADRLERIGFW